MNNYPKQLTFPSWVLFHVPHDSRTIPDSIRNQFLVSDQELEQEVIALTDLHTLDLFTQPIINPRVVRAEVNRLVVDVERFEHDTNEPMASRGMGAVYQVTSGLKPLRRILSPKERQELMDQWYVPHHKTLESRVGAILETYGQCLILDCHSFPSVQLPYEIADPSFGRPDICIGTDSYHTPSELNLAFVQAFESTGWSVMVNHPFAGALVPLSRYQKDPRVSSIMVEINRKLYMDEKSGMRLDDFSTTAHKIARCCAQAVTSTSFSKKKTCKYNINEKSRHPRPKSD